MKKINPFSKNKTPYKDNNPRVRNSYYTFSREYPAGNIPLKRRMYLRFKSERTKRLLYGLLATVIVCFSFFSVRLLLDISYKEPSDDGSSAVIYENEGQSVLEAEGFRALYMPYEKLGDSFYIRSFIKKIERKDCNGVVIDFKTESGRLCYSSLNLHAINGKTAVFDNNTVREALSLFRKEGITVAARIFCFLDNTIPSQSPSLAVKYMGTDVNWIDAAMGTEGKTWLNPCSKQAQAYLLDIIKELNNFNINGFILEKCHFPDSGSTDSATYPGEKKFKSRNAALKSFIASAKDVIDDNDFLIITQTANDALSGNKELYAGSISGASFDAVAAYTLNRPEEIVLDKKTDFVAVLGMFEDIKASNKDKAFIPIIDFSEYSRKYWRTVKKNSQSFILFDISGKY